MEIPKNWTFKDKDVAAGFDNHVREQLPWYNLATQAVAHIGRHYLPKNGRMYDIGASTGNIGRSLEKEIQERNIELIAIEESVQMAELYSGGGSIVVADALEYNFEMFDFAVCFLTMMFFPVPERRNWIHVLSSKIRPGGAIAIFDKILTPSGYAGTVLRRMAMRWKLDSGTDPAQIVEKELSLAGYQRPICPRIIEHCGNATQFFQFGEFAGWIIEKNE